jgi:hypothetical protein
MSSSRRDIYLEEIWTYDSTLITHDFIPTTVDAPHVETIPLAKNNDPLAENLGAEPAINENGGTPLENEQVGIEENEAPPANDHREEPQQENDDEPQPMRRSQRERRSVIPNNYVVYMNEDVNNIGKMHDPVSYKEAMKSENSLKWREAMEEELRSMSSNDVWDLVEIPDGAKRVGCKWVYKMKYDSKGKIERFKARLVAKGFTQREGIDYTETFSPVSNKDSFKIVMALVAHYDLELHQMDIKTTFLNGDLQENVYMAQPEGVSIEGKEHMGCRLKKSIYGLKQVSRQWYLKFDEVIKKFGFVKNQVDNCVYIKIKGSMFIILVHYVDDILLASSDKNLLHETKGFLSSNFDMKDLGDASYVLGIEIHRDRTKGMLGLSQKAYIEKVLKRYNMHECSTTHVPFMKGGGKLGTFQSPRNQLEINEMKSIPYASAVGSIMYIQVCAHPDLAFVTRLLGRF